MMWELRCVFLLTLFVASGLPQRAAAQTDGSRAAYASAAAMQEQGLYNLAADAWRELLAGEAAGPLAARAKYNLGVCRFHTGEFAEAAELFAAVADADRYPGVAEGALANLGLSRLNAARARLASPRPSSERVEADLRAAVAAFDAGVERYPDGELATPNRFHRGEALSLLERHKDAAEAFRSVIDADPAGKLVRRARVGLASALLELRSYREVIESVAAVVGDKTSPLTMAEALLLRGEARLALESPAEASADFAAASLVTGFADAPHAAERAAFSWYTAGEPANAAAAYDRLVARFPDSALIPAARLSAGKCWLLAKQPAKAAPRLEAAWRSSPTVENLEAARWWARSLLDAERPKDALAAAEQALALSPSEPAALTEIADAARLALATNRFAAGEAEAALERLRGVNGSDPGVARLRAMSLIALKQADAAEAAVRDAERLGLAPAQLAELRHELGWMHRDAGRSEAAVAAFQSAATKLPNSLLAAESLYRVGETHREAERHTEAAEAFAAAAKAAAQRDAELREQALHLLGWSRWRLGDRVKARRAFEEQLEAAPAGALASDARLMLGECWFADRRYREASAAYRSGLEGASPNQELLPMALLHAGQAAGQAGDWKASLTLLERARKVMKDSPLEDETAYERAWALHKLGRNAEAAPEFARLAGAAQGVLAARAAFVRGELHFAAGEHEQAVRMFYRVAYGFGGRKAAPGFHSWQAESLFEAARCFEQLDRIDQAVKLYAELVERFPESPKAEPARDRLTAAVAGG